MKKDTKQILLESGEEIFLQQGYNGSGLSDILKHAGVPKGSFYHYFENKEAFLIEVLKFYVENMSSAIAPFLDDTKKSGMKRFEALIKEIISDSKAEKCKGGCLIGNIAQEMCSSSDNIRAAVKDGAEAWVDVLDMFFKQAQKDGSLAKDYDSKALANTFADGWQGAILRMKIEKNIEPLNRFLRNFLDILEA